MKYKKILRHTFLILVTMTAAQLHAATTDYTLKYKTWELISVPNPIPFAINTPMKLFGEQIVAQLPLAVYGEDWIMYSWDSGGEGQFKVAEKDTVFEPGKGYWAIQVASRDDISVQVVTRYNIGATGPGGGIVFYVDPDTGGTSGLEAAPEDQVTWIQWCSISADIVGVDNIMRPETPDTNSGAHNTPLIRDVCGATSAAGVAADYVWPNGQYDGFLPNNQELDFLFTQRALAGIFDYVLYWSSSEWSKGYAWYQNFSRGPLNGRWKQSGGVSVRAVRAF